MFKKNLSKMELVSLGIQGLMVVTGIGLWIYGTIEEKKALKEISKINEEMENNTQELDELLKATGTIEND